MRYLRGSRRESGENDVHIPAQSVKGEIYRRKNHDGYRDVKQCPRRGRERDHGEGVNGRDEQHVLPRIAQPGKKPQRQRAAELVHGREQHRCRRLQCVAGRLRGRKHIPARRARTRTFRTRSAPPFRIFSARHGAAATAARFRALFRKNSFHPSTLSRPHRANFPSVTEKILRRAKCVGCRYTLSPEWACNSGKTGFTSRGELSTRRFQVRPEQVHVD